MNTFARQNQNFVHDIYGILLATNVIFEVQGWYGHENVCELQAWQQSFVFSGVLLCVSPVGHTKGCYIDQYDMW